MYLRLRLVFQILEIIKEVSYTEFIFFFILISMLAALATQLRRKCLKQSTCHDEDCLVINFLPCHLLSLFNSMLSVEESIACGMSWYSELPT
jgi:hypothetical protein